MLLVRCHVSRLQIHLPIHRLTGLPDLHPPKLPDIYSAPEHLRMRCFMKLKGMLTIAMASLTATAGLSQAPAGQRQGPGVQATNDARYQSVLAGCKNPPPPRGGGPGGPAGGAAAQGQNRG